MSNISADDVRKVAKLARLDLPEEKIATYTHQLERILNSDLDFIVRMKDPRQAGIARRFCGFADALEDLFGRPVDLLTEAMIRNPLFQSDVEQSRIVLVGPCDAS